MYIVCCVVYRLVSIICSIFWYCLFVLFVALLYNTYAYSFGIWMLCFLLQFSVGVKWSVCCCSCCIGLCGFVCVCSSDTYIVYIYSRHRQFYVGTFCNQYCRGKKVVNVSFCKSSRDMRVLWIVFSVFLFFSLWERLLWANRYWIYVRERANVNFPDEYIKFVWHIINKIPI